MGKPSFLRIFFYGQCVQHVGKVGLKYFSTYLRISFCTQNFNDVAREKLLVEPSSERRIGLLGQV